MVAIHIWCVPLSIYRKHCHLNHITSRIIPKIKGSHWIDYMNCLHCAARQAQCSVAAPSPGEEHILKRHLLPVK